ncbi:MAG: hypothetical protein M0037_16445, partial [Betaproteobacteria bacterium]|nr:hypothetical protein [Betaproteobacteria bacterium]
MYGPALLWADLLGLEVRLHPFMHEARLAHPASDQGFADLSFDRREDAPFRHTGGLCHRRAVSHGGRLLGVILAQAQFYRLHGAWQRVLVMVGKAFLEAQALRPIDQGVADLGADQMSG